MQKTAKLTVRVERAPLEAAKRYAQTHGTSLSRLITLFFQDLSRRETPASPTPVLDRLSGILPAAVARDEHRSHLERKYRG